MMDGLVTFLIAITLLTIAPGADTVLVIRNSLRAGTVDGVATTLGICSGLFIHATVSAVGISFIILQSAWLFTSLKYLGALYLLYLGFTTLRHANANEESMVKSSAGKLQIGRSLREGLLSNVLNPKPIVFYMAFLPQFIDPMGSALGQSLMLASLHFAISLVWLCVVAVTADRMRILVRDRLVRRWMDGVLGFGLCGFGVLLAADTYRE
ncbi:MAG: RhtB (resistance to homoserine/threonine) family protein [Candidatus Azotimanducaceae bacterium]|jgi:RhtB (resistance to homoserine/threonine) family protein